MLKHCCDSSFSNNMPWLPYLEIDLTSCTDSWCSWFPDCEVEIYCYLVCECLKTSIDALQTWRKLALFPAPGLQADVFPPLPAVSYTLFTSPFSSLKQLCRIPLEQGWNTHEVKTCMGQEGIVVQPPGWGEGLLHLTAEQEQSSLTGVPARGVNVTISLLFARLGGFHSCFWNTPQVCKLC